MRLYKSVLDQSIIHQFDDESLEISGYYLIRSDDPSNKKRGGICIYYKNLLPSKVPGVRLLEECIAFDFIISNKLCSFISFYKSPSQSLDDFATCSNENSRRIKFITKLQLSLCHLREHKFKHSFQDSLNLFCNFSLDIESTAHCLLHCPTVNATIEYVLSTKRCDEPLFQQKQEISKQGYESVNSVFVAVVICIICRFLILYSQDLFYSQAPLQFQVPGLF